MRSSAADPDQASCSDLPATNQARPSLAAAPAASASLAETPTQTTRTHLDPALLAPTPPAAPSAANARPFDIVVFGASGSVGRFVVEELALVVDKYYNSAGASTLVAGRDSSQFAQARRHSVPRQLDSIKWAVAGRSAIKLSEALCAAELSTGVRDLSVSVPVLLADLNHRKSLLDMCSKTSLVINCAGPYSVDGEPVVRACIESKTNYLDLAHEAAFVETIRHKYSADAQKANVFIINGCGFQSMSAEMGLNFTKQVTDGQIDEVKIILNLSNTRALIRPSGSDAQSTTCGIVSSGMWKSLLLDRAFALKTSREAKVKQRQQQQQQYSKAITQPDGTASNSLPRRDTLSLVTDLVAFKNRTSSLSLLSLLRGLNQGGRRFCLPVGSLSSDETQLIRGEMTSYELGRSDTSWKPVRCSSFLSAKNLSEVLILTLWMFIFNLIVIFAPLRALLYTFPSLGSLGLVCDAKVNRKLDRDALSHIKYCQTFVAYGTPGDDSGDPLERREKHAKRKQTQLLVARVVGPEPNHIAAATFCVQSAIVMLLERDHLPAGGGFYTPGSAFAETNIIYQLRKRNIKFEVLKKA